MRLKLNTDKIRWLQNYNKKVFLCSTQLSMKFVLLINLKLLIIANYFLLNIAEHEKFLCYFFFNFISLFISRKNCSAELSMKTFYELGTRFIMFELLNEKVNDVLILDITHTLIFGRTVLIYCLYSRKFI